MRMFLLTPTTNKQAADAKQNKPMNQFSGYFPRHLIREWEHSQRLTFNIPFIYHHTPTIALCFPPPLFICETFKIFYTVFHHLKSFGLS